MRRACDRLVAATAATASLLAVGLLALLVLFLLERAWPVLDPALLLEPARKAGAAGGLRYQLLGTALLAATSLAVTVPWAVALALAVTVYGRGQRWAAGLELALYTTNGIPSILFGLFAFVLFTQTLGWGKSWLAGGLVLGVMSVPTAALALAQRLAALPARYLEAGRALGLSRSRLIWRILLPQGRDGLLSGCLLGVARAAGETAPILFAAAVFSGATLPGGIQDSPVSALPYHIFVLAQDTFDPQARVRLWGAAWTLVTLALLFSLLALPLRLTATQEAHHG